jgi:transglutaminase-like putative cysteine protease
VLLEIRHRLRFRYDDFVRESQMDLRVEPATTSHQHLQAFHLAVGPPAAVDRYRDWNGNAVHHLDIRGYHDRIEVEARSVVEGQRPLSGLEDLVDPPPVAPGALLDFALMGGPVAGGPRLDALAREIDVAPDAPVGEQTAAIMRLVRERLRYVPGVTDWRSTAEEALAGGSGVCQDFAHVTLALLRRRRIPARYVSGYLHVGASAEPAQSHAWVEVHGTPGWVGIDPTHDRAPDELYVRVAVGRHYDDVPPNRGVFRGTASEELEASVETREAEPRDAVGLQRGIADLEVPVYSELPQLTRSRATAVEEQPPAPAAEQQQQQQQQQ